MDSTCNCGYRRRKHHENEGSNTFGIRRQKKADANVSKATEYTGILISLTRPDSTGLTRTRVKLISRLTNATGWALYKLHDFKTSSKQVKKNELNGEVYYYDAIQNVSSISLGKKISSNLQTQEGFLLVYIIQVLDGSILITRGSCRSGGGSAIGSTEASSFFFTSKSVPFSANALSKDDFATLVMHIIRITAPTQKKTGQNTHHTVSFHCSQRSEAN